jgi:hypothetical protein
VVTGTGNYYMVDWHENLFNVIGRTEIIVEKGVAFRFGDRNFTGNMILVNLYSKNRYEISNSDKGYDLYSHSLSNHYQTKTLEDAIWILVKQERTYTFLNLSEQSRLFIYKKLKPGAAYRNEFDSFISIRSELIDVDIDRNNYSSFIRQLYELYNQGEKYFEFDVNNQLPVFDEIIHLLKSTFKQKEMQFSEL